MKLSDEELRPLRLLFNKPQTAIMLATKLGSDLNDVCQVLEVLREVDLVRQVEPRPNFLWFITEAGRQAVKENSVRKVAK